MTGTLPHTPPLFFGPPLRDQHFSCEAKTKVLAVVKPPDGLDVDGSLSSLKRSPLSLAAGRKTSADERTHLVFCLQDRNPAA